MQNNDASLSSARAYFNTTVKETEKSLAASIRKSIKPTLSKRGIKGEPAHDPKMITMAAFCAARDIVRLSIYQEDKINPVKVYAYLCFWIRKLKIIQDAKDGNGESIRDINERLSLWLLSEFVGEHYKQAGNTEALVNFESFLKSGELFEYTVHSMQRRTFGPHHYTILVRTICEI